MLLMMRYAPAFKKIKRRDFVQSKMEDLASLDTALSIGYGQTISQPSVVVFMIQELQPRSGDKILDIGAGSGWTAALLAEIVGKRGKIIAVEIVPELKKFGEKNVEKYNFIKTGRVKFLLGSGSLGHKDEAPYDRILCSAAVQGEIPEEWKKQLKVGGKIVFPMDTSIWVFTKKSEKKFKKEEHPGFLFVPLVK